MTIPNQPGNREQVSLERGTFHDDFRTYRVCVSRADVPDSFQVLTGQGEDIVLIVSGIDSGELKATWGPFWRSFKPNWKVWVQESAFRVFYSLRQPIASAPGTWRFCEG